MNFDLVILTVVFLFNGIMSIVIHYKDFVGVSTNAIIDSLVVCIEKSFIETVFYNSINYIGALYIGHDFEILVSLLNAIITYIGSEKDVRVSILRAIIAFNMRHVVLHFAFFQSFLISVMFILLVHLFCYYFASFYKRISIVSYRRIDEFNDEE